MAIRRYAGSCDRERVLAIWPAASRLGHPFLGEADLEAQRRLVGDFYLERAERWQGTDTGSAAPWSTTPPRSRAR